jgi:hypothetical protein
MACTKCNKNEDCGCKATSVTIDSICNPIDCGTEECSESFPAQCILYTGEDIICDETTVITSGDSVAQSLANIVQFFCDRNDPTINADILCGEDVVVPIGTSISNALIAINNYFCDSINSLNLFALTQSSRLGTVDVNNPLCTNYLHTITYLDGGGNVITTTQFNTRTCEPLLIEDEGVLLPARTTIDFVGDGVTATDTGSKIEINVPGFAKYAQTNASIPINDIGTIPASLIGIGQGNLIFPANTLFLGNSYRGKMSGVLTSTNTQELNIFFNLNGIQVATSGSINMVVANASRWSLDFDFTIRSLGGAGQIILSSIFKYQPSSITSVIESEGLAFNATIIVDTTIQNIFDIQASYNLSEGANSIQSQFFVLNKTF